MKQTSSSEKMSRTTTLSSSPDVSAGPNGVAIAPPVYGIEVVDRQPIQATLEHEGHSPQPDNQNLDTLIQKKENKTGLPDNLKAGLENLSGMAMDKVKVHYHSSKPAQLQALAYTQGTDIHIGPGQEKHLPHEAWHVAQQMQGRVKPTMQVNGVAINDDEGLERESDKMGAKVLQLKGGHEKGCNCPGCAGSMTQLQGKFSAKSQSFSEAVIQRVCAECGRKSGHRSDCSRNKNRMRAKTKETKTKREESSSWENMQRYRPGWVKKNDITEEKVQAFCKQYDQRRIRGHHSEDQSQQEHENTTEDLKAYKSWHTKLYGWQ